MTLVAHALLTWPEAQAYLTAGASDQSVVEDMINRLTDYCESATGAYRPFVRRAFDWRLPGQLSPVLRLRASPIDTVAPITVTVDEAPLTVGVDVALRGDEPGQPNGLYRAAGWMGTPPEPIHVTFTGGFPFAALPGQIKECAYLILAQLYREQRKAISPDVASYGSGPVSPGVSFRLESLIPMKAREILSSYRGGVSG
jgi:hypothetical protein